MAFKAKSASETKAADLASAIVRIADREGAPLQVGVDQLRQGNPRLTPLAIGQLFRKHRDSLDAALAERGLHPRGLCRPGARPWHGLRDRPGLRLPQVSCVSERQTCRGARESAPVVGGTMPRWLFFAFVAALMLAVFGSAVIALRGTPAKPPVPGPGAALPHGPDAPVKRVQLQ